jgi:hypothetical protein
MIAHLSRWDHGLVRQIASGRRTEAEPNILSTLNHPEQNKKITEFIPRLLVRNPCGFLQPVIPTDSLGAFFFTRAQLTTL